MTLPPWYVLVSMCVGFCALVVGLTALTVATKNYRRKSGLLIRGSFTVAQSVDCNDHYVSKIILENMKDRGITIFSIFLRIGHNYYVELEDFEEKPLILKAYETYQQDFGPIQFYGLNGNRFSLKKLFSDRKIKKRLVLSTGDGKYVVPKSISQWNPILDMFKNHSTAVLRTVATTHKGKYVGANIKFVVEFFGENKKEEIVLLREQDFRIKRFNDFQLTQESLESKQSLEYFFKQQIDYGKLKVVSYKVHETKEWRQRIEEHYSHGEFPAEPYNWFQYYFLGKISTWLADRKLKKQNLELVKNRTNSVIPD